MKTERIKSAILTLFCSAMVVGLGACTTEGFERNAGTLPDKDALENVYGKLRSVNSAGNQQDLLMTEGTGFVTDNFGYSITQSMPSEIKLEAIINADLIADYNKINATDYQLLPSANYEFPDGQTITIEKDKRRSSIKRVKFLANSLAPGNYILPLTIASDATKKNAQDAVLYYTLTVRARQVSEYELNSSDLDPNSAYLVFYINTKDYQPLLVQDYLMQKSPIRGTEGEWYRTVGDLINLRTVTLDTDKTGRALLNLGSDMRYVLDHATKYIRPLQEQGRNVSLCIEGGGKGLGFCNLNDIQISDFVAQVKAIVETYQLNGINLWDRNSGYGKEGMPPMNTTSYPKLIVAMHDMLKSLGQDKLLTVTDHEKPTEYFWDTEATGGITVGQYLDYAWSGYRNGSELIQILDPWNPDALDEDGNPLISKYTHKAFAGLDPSKYGCINVPWYTSGADVEISESYHIYAWASNGYKQSNILVFEDLRTVLQDAYEGRWGISEAYGSFALDGPFSGRSGFSYSQDLSLLTTFPDGNKGYGKWKKDW